MSESSLPAGWFWSTVGEVGDVQLGRQRSPQHHQGQHMRPYLRVANVFEDRIDTRDIKSMNFNPDEFERFRLRHNDVLLNEGQSPELLGRPAIYRGDPPDVCFTNSLIRFRPFEAVEPEWALLTFRWHMHSGRFRRESRITTNIAHLSASRLKKVEFPVPPLAEQRRIVDAAASHFALLEAVLNDLRNLVGDVRLTPASQLGRLRRSILKAAYEGRLVARPGLSRTPELGPDGDLAAEIIALPASCSRLTRDLGRIADGG